jgi:hypothetical protein
MTYSIEKIFQIWNDSNGTRIEVGPDRDGLDLVEIREIDSAGITTSRITMDVDQVKLITQALNDTCKELA